MLILRRVFGFLWMPKKVAIAVTDRVAIEFIPPILAGVIWLWWNWPTVLGFTQGLEFFMKGFIAIAFGWWNFLRIQHQQMQRHEQSGIAGDVDNIKDEMTNLGGELRQAKTFMQSLEAMFKTLAAKLTPKEAEEVSDIVVAANSHLDIAKTSYEKVSEYLTYNTGSGVISIHRSQLPQANR
jgi:hypothetical protein